MNGWKCAALVLIGIVVMYGVLEDDIFEDFHDSTNFIISGRIYMRLLAIYIYN